MHRAIFLLLATSALAPALARDGQANGGWRALLGEVSSRAERGRSRISEQADRPALEERRQRILAEPIGDRAGRPEQRLPRLRSNRLGGESTHRSHEHGPAVEQVETLRRLRDWVGTVRSGRLADRRLEQPSATSASGGDRRTSEPVRPKDRVRIGDTVRIVRSQRPVSSQVGRAGEVEETAQRGISSTDWRRHQRAWTSDVAMPVSLGPRPMTRSEPTAKLGSGSVSRVSNERSWADALRSGSPRRPVVERATTPDPHRWSDNRRWRDHRHWQPWALHWRGDERFDWRRHRDRHGWLFRLGRYRDPFGFGYQRFVVGWNIWPTYYRSSYWISDPWSYRLPPADGRFRWVRYHNDALLIDLDSGEVVDVIYNFFW